jgi:hypothetical protein
LNLESIDPSQKLTLEEEDALRRDWNETGELHDGLDGQEEESSPTLLDHKLR